jgi:hypothetical protein
LKGGDVIANGSSRKICRAAASLALPLKASVFFPRRQKKKFQSCGKIFLVQCKKIRSFGENGGMLESASPTHIPIMHYVGRLFMPRQCS